MKTEKQIIEEFKLRFLKKLKKKVVSERVMKAAGDSARNAFDGYNACVKDVEKMVAKLD